MNLERTAEWQAQTDTFLRAKGVQVCGNDYTATTVNPVRRLFAPATSSNPNPRPVFAVINCVSNSPSHRYGELLVNEIYTGGGPQDFSNSIRSWRTRIDSVQAPPAPSVLGAPRFGPGGLFEFTVTGQPGSSYAIEASPDFDIWSRIVEDLPGSATGLIVTDPAQPLLPRRFYRAIKQ